MPAKAEEARRRTVRAAPGKEADAMAHERRDRHGEIVERTGTFLNRTIEYSRGQLVLERYRGNCCGGIFLAIWLSGWSYGLGLVLADAVYNPQSGSLFAVAIMGVAELIVIGIFAWNWTGRERLTVDAHGVMCEQRAVVTFRSTTIRIRAIESIDLVRLGPEDQKERRPAALEIQGEGRKIHYGLGLSGAELHVLLERVRDRVQQYVTIPLAPARIAETIEPITDEEREQRELAKPKPFLEKAKETILMPVMILIGSVLVWGGIGAVRTGFWLGILIGLLFVGVGVLLIVGNGIGIVLTVKDFSAKRRKQKRR